jgi:hypothetical protein
MMKQCQEGVACTTPLQQRQRTNRNDRGGTIEREAKLAIEKARQRFPLCNRNGVTMSSARQFIWDYDAIEHAIKWLRGCTRTKAPTYHSYMLKGRVERASGRYISNGDLICAAIYLDRSGRRPECGWDSWRDLQRREAI